MIAYTLPTRKEVEKSAVFGGIEKYIFRRYPAGQFNKHWNWKISNDGSRLQLFVSIECGKNKKMLFVKSYDFVKNAATGKVITW